MKEDTMKEDTMKVKRYAYLMEKFWGMARVGASGYHSYEEAQKAGEGLGYLGVFEYEADAEEAKVGDDIIGVWRKTP